MLNTAKNDAIAILSGKKPESKPRESGGVKEVSQDRMIKALHFLAETDMPYAKAKALVEGLSEQKKTIKALQYLSASAGTQGDRTELAYASREYQDHCKKLQDAILDMEYLRNKRQTEALIVDVWRSLNSARKQGMVI